MDDLERVAREAREKAEASRREREETQQRENERRRLERERLDKERRERIEADDRARRERLDAARRQREEALAKSRSARDALAGMAASPSAPAESAAPIETPIPKPSPPPVVEAHPVAAAPVRAVPVAAASPPPASAIPSSLVLRTALRRMVRASLFDPKAYEEIEADASATGHAAIIVAIGAVSVAAAEAMRQGGLSPSAALGSVATALLGWAAYSSAAAVVGTTIFRGKDTKSDWPEVARTLGFAASPRVLTVFAPAFASLFTVWIFLTSIIALRAALDTTGLRAAVVAIAAGALFLIGQLFAGALIQ